MGGGGIAFGLDVPALAVSFFPHSSQNSDPSRLSVPQYKHRIIAAMVST
jgi:hypothetical protein